jgi:hypothetical protein
VKIGGIKIARLKPSGPLIVVVRVDSEYVVGQLRRYARTGMLKTFTRGVDVVWLPKD